MAENTTMMKNMIDPEVMGDVIDAKLDAQCKLIPYAHVDDSLEGVPGDTKTIPCWAYIGDAEDVAEGVEVGVTQMSASTKQFTIKKAGKCIEITEEAILSGLGKPLDQANTQFTKSTMGKIDNDILDVALQAPVKAGDGSEAIGYNTVVDAVMTFEDEEDGVDKVMFIHPRQSGTLLKDESFLSADRFEKGVAVNGAIGKIAGCWIKKSKKVPLIEYTKDNSNGTISMTESNLTEYQKKTAETLAVGDKVKAVATKYYMCPIIKKEPDHKDTEYTENELAAVTIFRKRGVKVHDDFKARKQVHELSAFVYYGVALTNEEKVVVAKFKA